MQIQKSRKNSSHPKVHGSDRSKAELTGGKNGLDDGSNAQSLDQLQNLIVTRGKKHAQDVVRELALGQSLMEEMENQVVRHGRKIGEAVNVEHSSGERQVQKGRRGRHAGGVECATEEREAASERETGQRDAAGRCRGHGLAKPPADLPSAH